MSAPSALIMLALREQCRGDAVAPTCHDDFDDHAHSHPLADGQSIDQGVDPGGSTPPRIERGDYSGAQVLPVQTWTWFVVVL